VRGVGSGKGKSLSDVRLDPPIGVTSPPDAEIDSLSCTLYGNTDEESKLIESM